jgi:hypothetical protein
MLPAAAAQTPSPQQPSQQPSSRAPQAGSPQGQSANIPDEKLSKAAAALQHVASIKQDYAQRLQQAPDSDKQRLVDEANKALTQAITDQGLSIEEYTSILVVAQSDDQVRAKILQRIQQQQQ